MHSSAITKIAERRLLFKSTNTEVMIFRDHAQEPLLPLASARQFVELKVKDTIQYESTGHTEENVSGLAMTYSVIILQANNTAKESDKFKNCKRHNDN